MACRRRLLGRATEIWTRRFCRVVVATVAVVAAVGTAPRRHSPCTPRSRPCTLRSPLRAARRSAPARPARPGRRPNRVAPYRVVVNESFEAGCGPRSSGTSRPRAAAPRRGLALRGRAFKGGVLKAPRIDAVALEERRKRGGKEENAVKDGEEEKKEEGSRNDSNDNDVRRSARPSGGKVWASVMGGRSHRKGKGDHHRHHHQKQDSYYYHYYHYHNKAQLHHHHQRRTYQYRREYDRHGQQQQGQHRQQQHARKDSRGTSPGASSSPSTSSGNSNKSKEHSHESNVKSPFPFVSLPLPARGSSAELTRPPPGITPATPIQLHTLVPRRARSPALPHRAHQMHCPAPDVRPRPPRRRPLRDASHDAHQVSQVTAAAVASTDAVAPPGILVNVRHHARGHRSLTITFTAAVPVRRAQLGRQSGAAVANGAVGPSVSAF